MDDLNLLHVKDSSVPSMLSLPNTSDHESANQSLHAKNSSVSSVLSIPKTPDFIRKLVIVGDMSCGKSCLFV